MTWSSGVVAMLAGAVIAVLTTPVGVSGAVFLLPVQVSVLGIPSPAVTPTNLLFNVVAAPGSLLRYRRTGGLAGPLTRQMLAGTLPGVLAGAVLRVFLVPGPQVFRLIIAAVLLPLGVWLCARPARTAESTHRPPSARTITGLAVAVGLIGGIYGIGGGSLLGPVLVGRGLPVTRVAPAALASTFVTSLAGAAAYLLLAMTTPGPIAPNWPVGMLTGLGGLAGGYLGARLQPRLPATLLRRMLGVLATALAALYTIQALT